MKYLMFVISLILIACKPTEVIKPVDLPVSQFQNFNFPESQETVYSWVDKDDTESVAKHAWGIWAGLTAKTDQKYNGFPLLVFETWHGVGELADASARGERSYGCLATKASRNALKTPKQFAHGRLLGSAITTDYAVLESVAYSPDAACFATSNLLFNQSVLDRMLVRGDIGKIPDFPVRSITTKPTYYVATPTNNLLRVPAWKTTPVPAKEYGHHAWGTYVYADLTNSQEPNKKLVPVSVENPTPEQIAAATTNVDDFIHFSIDEDVAAFLNSKQDNGTDPTHQFKAGEVALLVAMHVTSKEIKNWTWQTFYWAPNPLDPGEPSSRDYAALMPENVEGSARHYAVSPCYAMTTQGGDPLICYNPYLEAGFGPKVFKQENKWRPEFQYGVQTNCMSCHALATSTGNLGYTTDQNIDVNSPMFINDVQLDFAWSIQGNINPKK